MTTSNKVFGIVLIAAVIFIVLFAMAYLSGYADAERKSIYDCVIRTAIAEKYAGDVYSKDAYDIFSHACK